MGETEAKEVVTAGWVEGSRHSTEAEKGVAAKGTCMQFLSPSLQVPPGH